MVWLILIQSWLGISNVLKNGSHTLPEINGWCVVQYEACLRELLCDVSKGISHDVWLSSSVRSMSTFHKQFLFQLFIMIKCWKWHNSLIGITVIKFIKSALQQSVFIVSTFAKYMWHGKKCCQEFCKNIPHQQCCIKQQHTEQQCMSWSFHCNKTQ